MADDGHEPWRDAADAAAARILVGPEDFLDRADVIDGGVRAVLAELDPTRTDAEYERVLDALMGVSRAADALRALARNDLSAAQEATRAMGHYADRALGDR